MRKSFFFILIALLTSASIQAQDNTKAKKRTNWGLKTGMNISTLMSDEDDNEKNKWKTGFVLGAFFIIKAGENFSLQPEFLYSSMGGKFDNVLTGESSIRLNYFSIPLLAKFKLAGKCSLVAGPQFDFLINAKSFKSTNEEEVSNVFEDKSINITGGFEYWPVNKVGFSARYTHGLTDIRPGNGELKNQGVQITIALKL